MSEDVKAAMFDPTWGGRDVSEYTPTTEDVRDAYPLGRILPAFYDPDYGPTIERREREFDRWLAEHDRTVIAAYLDKLAEELVTAGWARPAREWLRSKARELREGTA